MTNKNVDPAERLAMFRYCVISEAISPRLSPAERGRVVRELTARTWATPEGTERSFSRTSIDRWLRAYSKEGLAGLAKLPRSDRGRPRREERWLAEAARLRRAVPARSSAQIVDIIGRAHGVWLSERTVREHLRRLGLSRQALSSAPARAYGRFEASRPNEIWIGDVLHGPFVPHPRPRGQKERSCSYWSTTTAGCSCTGAGSQKRTPGPARTCCAQQFHAGGCPRSSMPIMGPLFEPPAGQGLRRARHCLGP